MRICGLAVSNSKSHILFADDDEDILFAGALLLRQEGYRVSTLQDPEKIPETLKELKPDLLLLDMNFRGTVHSGNEGLYWLRQVLKLSDIPVVMVTAYGDIELAVQAIQDGAAHFVTKPWQNSKLIETVELCLKKNRKSRLTEPKPQAQTGMEQLMGNSQPMQVIRETIRKIAPTDASVLILGENGTGKEVVARLLHSLSPRAKHPFVTVDMGAIPETLFESELFGHKKGAFTDAREDKKGKFELAQGGTLFMDEIGNLPLSLQSKLLVALQNREVRPLGSTEVIKLDIRLISASNAPLPELAAEKKFRQDLLYRLNTVNLTLPPLRERSGDLELLAGFFLREYAAKYARNIHSLSPGALRKMNRHSWPGNVRELQHVIERAVILCEHTELTEVDLDLDAGQSVNQRMESSNQSTLEDMEKRLIENALQKHRGNISGVAQELGLSRAALYRRLSKYKL